MIRLKPAHSSSTGLQKFNTWAFEKESNQPSDQYMGS